MYAVKANKIYEIEAAEKQKFIDRGYQIAELKDDKLVFKEIETKESKEITKLKEEIKALKAENKKLETENKKLETENKKLETELKKSKGEGK